VLKHNCWYRTDPAADVGPFPINWFFNSESATKIQPWFPLPSNLINKGEQWVPEIKQNATVCFPTSLEFNFL
jgi:hypothetical protein